MGKGSVLVAMSGGVDSSTTAFLLKEQGYEVIGVTMRLFDDDMTDSNRNRPCCSTTMAARAAAVCRQLDIPHYLVDFRDSFKREVMDDFFEQYLSGYTPNPCVRCNTYIKWEPLVKKKKQLGADYIATGHYARISKNGSSGKHELSRGKDQLKDQSYFLWGLTEELLRFTFFPLGDKTKKEVRQLAKKYNLAAAETPESMDVCFIPDNDYRSFIDARMKSDGLTSETGNFIDTNGNIVGEHNGYHNFTVGQRKGLGISMGRKVFVTGIMPSDNTVIIGDEEELDSGSLTASSVSWVNGLPEEKDRIVEVKIRYRDPGTEARLIPGDNNTVSALFTRPVKAVTPGQSAVFYRNNRLIGGGIIARNK